MVRFATLCPLASPRMRALACVAGIALFDALFLGRMGVPGPAAETSFEVEVKACHAIQWQLAKALAGIELAHGCVHVGMPAGDRQATSLAEGLWFAWDGPERGWPRGIELSGVPSDPGTFPGDEDAWYLTHHDGIGLACRRHGWAAPSVVYVSRFGTGPAPTPADWLGRSGRVTPRSQLVDAGGRPEDKGWVSDRALPGFDPTTVPGVVPEALNLLRDPDRAGAVEELQRILAAGLPPPPDQGRNR